MDMKKLGYLTLAGAGVVLLAQKMARQQRFIGLQDRVVLITGGSRGLGLALAREFAEHHARVAIVARDSGELAAAKSELAKHDLDVMTLVCDTTDQAQVKSVVAEVEEKLGYIDVLINNAGSIIVGPMENMSLDDFHRTMDVNLWGALHLTLAVLPGMQDRKQGRIVNIASVGGKIPVPHLLPYVASKFALVGLSSGMRLELLKDSIYVTTVNPGLMRTGSPRNADFKGNHQAEYAWFAIGDNLPGIAISARTAARRIADAVQHGDSEITLGLPAQISTKLHALAPQTAQEFSGLLARLFPRATESGQETKRGRDSEHRVTRAALDLLGRGAESEYNQR